MSTIKVTNLRHENATSDNIGLDSSGNVAIQSGAAGTPSLYFSGDANTGIYSSGADSVAISTGGTTALTVDSSQRVLIGDTSAGGTGRYLTVGNTSSANTYLEIRNSTSGDGGLTFADSAGGVRGLVGYSHATDNLDIWSSGSFKTRIDSSGRMLIGKTSTSIGTAGLVFGSNDVGTAKAGIIVTTVDSEESIYINRLTNDGNLISFRQDGTQEGTISVSGSTVQLNGAHLARWSQLLDGGREEILRGTVLTNLDEMCEWAYDAEPEVLWAEDDELPEGVSVGDVKTPAKAAGTEENEQLNRMKVSDVEGDPNVAGVFVDWDNDDNTYADDFYCAMTGDFIIRIAEGVTVQRGDLLMSAGDGTAKPQDDDIIRSKTVAKVTSNHITCTYDDGSYCVPCVLMAC